MLFEDNIIIRLPNGKFLLFNLFNFRRMIVPKKYVCIFDKSNQLNERNFNQLKHEFIQLLKSKKQILTNQEKKYLDNYVLKNFSNHVDDNILSPILLLTYKCNCSCVYCYQNIKSEAVMTESHIDNIVKFYQFIKGETYQDYKFNLYVSGGEPLLPETKKIINYILKMWPDAYLYFQTNGINIPMLFSSMPSSRISRFKISLDGIKEIHDQRRRLKGSNSGSFDKVVYGIDAALEQNINVDLKMTLDSETILYFPDAMEFFEAKGWLNDPLISIGISSVFNYENGIGLDNSYNTIDDMINRYEKVKNKCESIKYVKNNLFYGIEGLKRLILRDSDQFVAPSLHRCQLLYKPNYTFDPLGNIYLCQQGLEKSIIGKFHPHIQFDREMIIKLKKRHVLNMDKCKNCNFRYICLGGCPSSANLKNNSFLEADCGYFKNEDLLQNLDKILF